jgi:hypothetical protein
MMRTLAVAAAVLSLATLAAAAGGEAAKADLDVLRDAIRANKKAIVAASLKLTDDEAGKFWPVYDRYETELKALNDKLVALVQDYTTSFPNFTDEKAKSIADQYLTEEADRAKLRRTYLDEFAKALPGRKVARLYQIENKMDAVIRYDLAASIPVVAD